MAALNRLVPAGSMSGRLAPAVVGGGQLQADLVLEHMGRRVDLDVHGSPEGDPHRRAVRGRGLLVSQAWVSHSMHSRCLCAESKYTEPSVWWSRTVALPGSTRSAKAEMAGKGSGTAAVSVTESSKNYGWAPLGLVWIVAAVSRPTWLRRCASAW
jgi:hypothetical protein